MACPSRLRNRLLVLGLAGSMAACSSSISGLVQPGDKVVTGTYSSVPWHHMRVEVSDRRVFRGRADTGTSTAAKKKLGRFNNVNGVMYPVVLAMPTWDETNRREVYREYTREAEGEPTTGRCDLGGSEELTFSWR